MSERKKILNFTIALEELLSANISINEALYELAKSNFVSDSIRVGCKEILEAISFGNGFSNAISACKNIRFDESYIAFVSCAEETGNLEKIFLYLKNSRTKNADFISNLKTILIYPTIIFLMLISFTVALFLYGEKVFLIFSFENTLISDFSKRLTFSCVFGLILVFFILILILRIVISIFLCDLKSSVFSALSILIKSEVCLEKALDCAIRIAILSPQIEFFLMDILEKARIGQSFSAISNENRALDSYSMMIFSVGAKTGSLKNAFSNISTHYEKKTEYYTNLFIRFLEPVLICMAAIYLVVLLFSLFLAGV